MSETVKHQCPLCNRPLRRVSYGDREFWRCEGWFDTDDACFAAFDDVTIKEGIDLEKLDWPISDDEKIH